jgi:hypothetical protein
LCPFSREAHLAFVDANIAQLGAARLRAGPRARNADPAPSLAAGGAISLNGATLSVDALNGFNPSAGEVYNIIQNATGSAVSGTFAGLAEGAIIVSFSVGGGGWLNGGAGGRLSPGSAPACLGSQDWLPLEHSHRLLVRRRSRKCHSAGGRIG